MGRGPGVAPPACSAMSTPACSRGRARPRARPFATGSARGADAPRRRPRARDRAGARGPASRRDRRLARRPAPGAARLGESSGRGRRARCGSARSPRRPRPPPRARPAAPRRSRPTPGPVPAATTPTVSLADPHRDGVRDLGRRRMVGSPCTAHGGMLADAPQLLGAERARRTHHRVARARGWRSPPGWPSASAAAAATLCRSSPATAPETSVSGVGREADPSAPRPGTDFRLLSNARARCMLAAHAGPGDRDFGSCRRRRRLTRPGRRPGHAVRVSERRDVGRVHLVAVLGRVADLHVLVGHPQAG